MSLFSRQQVREVPMIPSPGSRPRVGTVHVSEDTALRHSAVWAALRLRADLISTMPIDVYRKIGGVQVEVPKPPVLVNPGGERVGLPEWLYSSQVDLDRAGNVLGLITARDGNNLPARIELQPLGDWTIAREKGKLVYRVRGTTYQPNEVWHEKQFTIAGLEVGLSPVAMAAWSLGAYLSAQQFAIDWFSGGAIPAARLKNTAKKINAGEAEIVRARYKAAVDGRDLFVHGQDWEYAPIQTVDHQTQFIQLMNWGVPEVARFFGVPADTLDATVSTGGNITYANITQKNLQLLIQNLGPAISRREWALSTLLSAPRFVKFNPDSLLRMDPQMRANVIKTRIDSRQLAPSEGRALDNLAPFTPDQIAEFETLFGSPRTPPTGAST